MPNLSYVAEASVERVTASVKSQDFAIPAIAAYFATSISSQRKLVFTDADAAAQSFPASGETKGINQALSAFFAQSPRPASVAVLRLALPSTKSFDITPTAANSKDYKVKVNGVEVVYTSDGSATVAEITAGLTLAINALAVSGVTATDNTTKVTVAGTSGTWFSIDLSGSRDDGVMTVKETTADPGIATDLAAIQTADKNWYAFTLMDGSNAIIDSASSWAQSNAKFFVPCTQDSDVLTSATNDALSNLVTGTRDRTLGFFHHAPRQFAPMALLGRVLATTPGKRTFYHKSLSGISVTDLNDTEIGHLNDKFGNFYVDYGGLNRTEGGKVAGNEWGEIIIGADYYQSRLVTRHANTLLGAVDKVPGDQDGIDLGAKDVKATVEEMVANNFARLDFVAYPELGYSLTIPTPASIDINTRELDGLAADVKLNGGIKKFKTTLRLIAGA